MPMDQKIASKRELEKKGVNPVPPGKYLLHFGSGQSKEGNEAFGKNDSDGGGIKSKPL